jgi:hypothetical protein
MKFRIIKLNLFFSFLPLFLMAQYTGTGKVSQGRATATSTNIFTCTNGRVTSIGNSVATDNSNWAVPSANHFNDINFPVASDLHNTCNGATYSNATAAIAALNGNDIVTIDASGEVYTAYIFADNYFELYINGVPVGKDKVPYTQFNSSVVRFKVNKPFTIAMLLVDWEENLGLGTELNGSAAYHAGDGGLVCVIKNSSNQTVAISNDNWKAQTFYTSPIQDLTCPTEVGNLRLTANCSTDDVSNGENNYALHWEVPSNVMLSTFDDTNWPNASVFSNATVGVMNKPAYTNFTDIFDEPVNDAQFIWSSNLILDNQVIVRHTVNNTLGIEEYNNGTIEIYPNPSNAIFYLQSQNYSIKNIKVYDLLGNLLTDKYSEFDQINLAHLTKGTYLIKVQTYNSILNKKVIIN